MWKDWSEMKAIQPVSQEIPLKIQLDSTHTHNATYINYRDFERKTPEYAYWKKLDAYNSGRSNLMHTNKPYATYIYNLYLSNALASALQLTPDQTRRFQDLFMPLDTGTVGFRVEYVAYCLCAVVAHSDRRPCHPNTSPDNRDPEFCWVARSIGLNESVFGKLYHRLHHRLRTEAIEDSSWRTEFDSRRDTPDTDRERGI